MGADTSTANGETDGDRVYFTGFLDSYPAGGFAAVTASETASGTDRELWLAANVTETSSGASYIVNLTTATGATANDIGSS